MVIFKEVVRTNYLTGAYPVMLCPIKDCTNGYCFIQN